MKGCLFCKTLKDYKTIQLKPEFEYRYTVAIVSKLYKIGRPDSRATSTDYGFDRFKINFCPMCGQRVNKEEHA